MASQQPQPNMGHRHSLTIETNPLHLLPSNVRRFSQADQLKGAVKTDLFAKINNNNGIPEAREEKKEEGTSSATANNK